MTDDVDELPRRWNAIEQQAFGRRLRAVRDALQLDEAAAATACGVSPAMYKRYESGASTMRTKRFMRFIRSVAAPEDIEWAYAWLLEGGTGFGGDLH